MMKRFAGVGVLALVAVLGTGCDEALSTVAGPTPNLEPRFSSIQQFIFEAPDSTGRPACGNCHNNDGGRRPAGGLLLRGPGAYANLVGVASGQRPDTQRINAGNPEGSYLLHKIEGRSGITGQRMPIGGGQYLSSGQILIIRRWIELGARND